MPFPDLPAIPPRADSFLWIGGSIGKLPAAGLRHTATSREKYRVMKLPSFYENSVHFTAPFA